MKKHDCTVWISLGLEGQLRFFFLKKKVQGVQGKKYLKFIKEEMS